MSHPCWNIWVVTTVTALTTMYEAAALLTGVTTISTALRTSAENHHPVYMFAGILGGFLFMASLTGWNFPLIGEPLPRTAPEGPR